VKRKIVWIPLGLTAALGSGLALSSLVMRGESTGGVALHEIARGRFVRRVVADGYLKAVKATPINAPQRESRDGMKILWIAEDGAHLAAGETIVQFDPTAFEKALEDSRDDRSSAGHRAHKARVSAEAARANLSDDAATAAREKEHAEKFASQDESIFSRNEIIESTIDRDLAEKKSARTGWKIGKTAEQSRVEIGIEEIHGAAAEREMQRAEAALSALTVLAPYDGIVSLERNFRGESVRVGDSVWPGQKIAEIPDLGAMEARVYVLEADAGGLAPGRDAEVVLAASPDVVIPGKVIRVDAIAKSLRREVPVQYFESIVSLSPPPGMILKPGQRVRASIVLEDRPDSLTAPRQSVFEKDGKKVVYRAVGGRLEPVEVKVASYGIGSVLFEDGVREGDRIALRDPAAPGSGR